MAINGGAVYNIGRSEFNDTKFLGCSAVGLGGQVYNGDAATVFFYDSEMAEGRARAGGGLANMNGIATLSSVKMSNNTAADFGGDIITSGDAAKLVVMSSASNMSFAHGSGGSIAMVGAQKVTEYFGRVLRGGNGGGLLRIVSTRFEHCGAALNGGCLATFEAGYGNLTLENIIIVNAVLVAKTYQLLSPVLMRRGGSIFLSGKTTTTAHNLFMKNGFNEASDVYRGGGIYIGEMATMHVEGINCISMYASDDGACIYITESAALNIVDGNIVGTANISSAVAAVSQSSLSWDQKLSDEYDYTNNLRVTVKRFALNITGVSFLENRGRALRVFSSTARLTDCSFTNDGYSIDTRTQDV